MAAAMLDPLFRVSEVGTHLARTPLRLLEGLAEPVRRDLQKDVRHSLGVPERPVPLVTDPNRVYLAPDAVAREVHADIPAMVIGGLSALFLQVLHPLTMAGVAEHSSYAEDPIGRLRRTAAFVSFTTFGTTDQARRAIEQVRRVHRRVQGVAPDGRAYSASDPQLVTWVHAAETSSFLCSAQRFGRSRLDPEQCDRYLAETAVVAYELGATWVPRSRAELDAYFRRLQPDLYAGDQARETRDFLLRGVARRPEDHVVYTVIAAAALSILPAWARGELGVPNPPLVDRLFVVPLARALCATVRWALPGEPSLLAEDPADVP
jgi:uncharacterized protein (DUF2236 family)